MAEFQLAQLNIARMMYAFDSPSMAGFVENLDRINSLADQSPGFVWRLVDDDEPGSDQQFDDQTLVNLSVWASLHSLREFVYGSDHIEIMRGRKAWFRKITGAHLVLWWVPTGHRPTEMEAHERLQILQDNGPSPRAFNFRNAFRPDGSAYESTFEELSS